MSITPSSTTRGQNNGLFQRSVNGTMTATAACSDGKLMVPLLANCMVRVIVCCSRFRRRADNTRPDQPWFEWFEWTLPRDQADRDRPPSINRSCGLGREERIAPPFATRRRFDPDSNSASVATSSAAMIAGRVFEPAARRH